MYVLDNNKLINYIDIIMYNNYNNLLVVDLHRELMMEKVLQLVWEPLSVVSCWQ